MQNNPAYGIIPSEFIRNTSRMTTREENEGIAHHSIYITKQKQAVPKLSTIALILAIIALIATLVCFILIFTNSSDTQADGGELHNSA